jgi:Erv1 / Alr family
VCVNVILLNKNKYEKMETLNPIDPKVWGPHLWKFMHMMAYSYPENPNVQVRASGRQFFYTLRHLIPCETCQKHFNDLISKKSPQVDSKQQMQEYVLWLHNQVNSDINPQSIPWSLSQVNAQYHTKNESCEHEQLNQNHNHIGYSPRSHQLIKQLPTRPMSKKPSSSPIVNTKTFNKPNIASVFPHHSSNQKNAHPINNRQSVNQRQSNQRQSNQRQSNQRQVNKYNHGSYHKNNNNTISSGTFICKTHGNKKCGCLKKII